MNAGEREEESKRPTLNVQRRSSDFAEKREKPIRLRWMSVQSCKRSIDLVPRLITIYETKTYLPQQYRNWLRSIVSQLRQHAKHLAK